MRNSQMNMKNKRLNWKISSKSIDEMEQMGIIGPHEGSKPRQVLIKHKQFIGNDKVNE